MAVNIKLEYKLTGIAVALGFSLLFPSFFLAYAGTGISEPVQACILARDVDLTDAMRANIAHCLGWQSDNASPLCVGAYKPLSVTPIANVDEVRIQADEASFYNVNHRSHLQGNVEIQQAQRIVNAQTAYIYRNPKTNAVDKIELLGNVHFLEPERLMIAQKATLNPQDKSGLVSDVLYRFNSTRRNAILPAWGRAAIIQRLANKDYVLEKATYSNCAPQDRAWELDAEKITLDDAKGVGVAKHVVLRLHDWPVFYTPYISFPTNHERKSGFLLPMGGYTTKVGGDLALPYYLNLAPNYDATLTPHIYTRRGLMLGGVFRHLTFNTKGVLEGNILPGDHTFKSFLQANSAQHPDFVNVSSNRWFVGAKQHIDFSKNLQLNVNFKQVSDDYYLQDFSSNLAVITERQLLREAALAYTTDHWLLRGLVQSYQTLNPINQSVIDNIYQLLPQLAATGYYTDLPLGTHFHVLGQYDQFYWPRRDINKPEGARFHFNPVLSLPMMKPWGYFTPSVQLVENYYDINETVSQVNNHFNRSIPRFSVDSGLYFDRNIAFAGHAFRQTLEPRLYYLNVPYQNQANIPVYDSAYMIFNIDQLFRSNRFSGYDRIGDANQLAYAVTTRWISQETGSERASLAIGQMQYFSNRQVKLCQSITGNCVDDPLALGFLPPDANASPIAGRAVYHFNSAWAVLGDYVWDPATHATNNGQLNLHYQPAINEIIQVGYTYLLNGDQTQVAGNAIQNNALHQATIGFSWPINEKWSTLGAYSYNISKRYSMLSFLGLQYDSCCWAFRVLGGQSFDSIGPQNKPQYNNSVFFQILLKGLGSVATLDPSSTISTYIPGYKDEFHR